ncbi:threonine aldolase family protein [Sphingobacterium endophyticum]|uniref:threonine aldolase family protein n=1 Tax=Sphingobacterium endophyticum TaxID=2546448 RepID=UPI0012E2954C|nr:aminotransferase class V-fold PLP-dependent enzyme [Sphingobacterium endophyticum]
MESKISFKNDYSEGAHPKVLELLQQTNLSQEPGYGADSISQKAKEYIIRATKNPDAQVFFVSGGTQANLLVISHLLKPYESVIAADSGHIEVHETGAIENTGHKINLIPNINGKIKGAEIQKIVNNHTDNHMVKPAMVYISQSTEFGTVYSKNELQDIANCCKKNNLLLFIDGARLATALTSQSNDLTLQEIAKLADVFYIGGTKNGALLGEAIVFQNKRLAEGFDFTLKQKGALMAKGRLLGAQFLALFQDDLFFELGFHANKLASKIANIFKQNGYDFATEPVSNQIFPILPISIAEKLMEKYDFYIWEKLEDNMVTLRIVTSWATQESSVDQFIKDISKNLG